MAHAITARIIPLGLHAESVIHEAIRGDTLASIRAVVERGKGKMNSAHVLNVFSTFDDEDWDRALLIWWQILAVFCFFGGAISAAVWA